MLVKIDKKTEATIARMVEDGDVRDASEAVELAVSRLAEMNKRRAELDAALQIGIDQLDRGEKVRLTPQVAVEIFEEGKRRFEAGQVRKRDVLP